MWYTIHTFNKNGFSFIHRTKCAKYLGDTIIIDQPREKIRYELKVDTQSKIRMSKIDLHALARQCQLTQHLSVTWKSVGCDICTPWSFWKHGQLFFAQLSKCRHQFSSSCCVSNLRYTHKDCLSSQIRHCSLAIKHGIGSSARTSFIFAFILKKTQTLKVCSCRDHTFTNVRNAFNVPRI